MKTLIILPFCLTNALEGFRNIDIELEEMGASMSRNGWRRFTRLTLPLVMPFLAAGLRISFGICWKIALVAELFGAQSGLGYLLLQAQANADATMVFAVCFVIVIVVFRDRRFRSRAAGAGLFQKSRCHVMKTWSTVPHSAEARHRRRSRRGGRTAGVPAWHRRQQAQLA